MCAFGGKSKQGNSSSGAGTGRSLMSTLSMNSGARTALSYCGNGAIAAAGPAVQPPKVEMSRK